MICCINIFWRTDNEVPGQNYGGNITKDMDKI